MAVRGSARRQGLLVALFGAPLLVALAIGASVPVRAQQAVGIDPGRDCQTIRTCNYSRGGTFRGCLSSYTCRVCRTQRVRCTASDIASGRTRCTEFVCTWGG